MTHNLFLMYKKPQLRFFVVLAAVLVVFLSLSQSTAAAKGGAEGGRYFIASKSYIVKSLFGVQHEFEKGFTADLTTGEVWTLEKIFKVGVAPVPLYTVSNITISEPNSGDPAASVITEAVNVLQEEVLKDSSKIKTRSFTPRDAVPWGVKKIYGSEIIKSTLGGKGISVAVLDTGANIRHDDIAGRVQDCKDFTRGPVPRSACEDKHGHGTHVAGTVAADGGFDGRGIWGVASEANLLIYKVCRNDGTCWADDVASALSYAVKNKAHIISLSLGGNTENFLVREAIGEAVNGNVLVVAAGGNDGPEKGTIDWPAAYANVVAVGAIAENELVPDWSSRGVNDGDYVMEEREVEFGAPGVNVESTWLDGSYRYLSGSSMAAPHISGLAARLWNGSATSTRVLISRRARDIWALGDDTATGFGLPTAPKFQVVE
ncbi:MAG: S8 family peptidase [Patescibacteria group bacterium]